MDALAERMRRLDESAVEEFSRTFGPRLRRYFLKNGLPEADADELACTCITKAWMHVDGFSVDRPGSFERWVFRLAHNERMDEYRRRRRSPFIGLAGRDEVYGESGWEAHDDRQDDIDLTDQVREAVATLPAQDQDVINLRYLEAQEPFAEIGRRLGVKEAAARVRCHRALRVLEGRLAHLRPETEALP